MNGATLYMSNLSIPKRLGLLGPRLINRECHDWSGWNCGFAAHADYASNQPLAIIACRTSGDVKKALNWAVSNSLPIRPRGGRHNYCGHSSCVKDGCIIDTSGLKKFKVDVKRQTARLGAGLTMLELTEGLNRYNFGIPYATGASVGLAGFLLGGGVGVESRIWGLGSDHVLGFELIGPNTGGRPRWIDPKTDPDLYFACLGSGGGNFGIVTEFEVRLQQIKTVALVQASWEWDQFESVVNSWQRNAPKANPRLSTFLTLSADRTIRLQGQFTDDTDTEEYVRNLVRDLFAESPPDTLDVTIVPHSLATRTFLRISPEAPRGWHNLIKQQLFKSTSAFADSPLPPEALSLLRHSLESHPVLHAAPSQIGMVQLLAGGGKVAEPPEHPTATDHRKSLFILQYNGYWTAPEDRRPVQCWTTGIRTSLLPWTSGAYINYVDDEIPEPDRQATYFGADAPRLLQLKAAYDPKRVFSYPHGL